MSGLLVPPHVRAKAATSLAGRCGSCGFFQEDSDKNYVCTRYPPQVTILLVPTQAPVVRAKAGMAVRPHPFASYPPISETTLACGEWKAREGT